MKTSLIRGWLSLPLLLFLTISCTEKADPDILPPGPDGIDLSAIHVSAAPPPLFATLPGDKERFGTKSLLETVDLESVLSRTGRRESAIKGSRITQIPFSSGYSGQWAYFGDDPAGDPGEASVMKRFLLVSDGDIFVVTMVAGFRYWRAYPSFDYLDKPDYTGAVIFSTVTGKLVKVQAYDSGRILPADFVDVSVTGAGGALSYIVVYSEDPGTKAGPDGAGEPVGSYAVSVGGEGTESPWYWDPEGESAAVPEKSYTVSLSCDIPDEVEMTGGGTYTAESTVFVDFSQKYSVKVLKLDHWTGDFAWTKSIRFSHRLTGDVESTAWFETRMPCASRSKGITNPLIEMRIAASNVSMALADADERMYVNYYGGTFGDTRTDRDGNPRRHDGLDLYAEVGTPVYAVCSGVVSKAVSSFGAAHVDNSYGNELRVSATEKGVTVTYQYAHLQSFTPIATNPRTGHPFKEGDRVYQGDLIGYAGRTGNATDVPNPHLHFGVNKGGKWIDPKPYINGTYPTGQKSIDKGKGRITGIRCD